MADPILGIHHITAVASNPQRNLNFYTQALGLRLVKLTVNFDDPGTYHFYFGDTLGHPGTVLTFFPWQSIRRGRLGSGQVAAVSFSIPAGSTGFWVDRLKSMNVEMTGPARRFDEEVISLYDPDLLPLELVTSRSPLPAEPWDGGTVPAEHAIRGFAAPTLLQVNAEGTIRLLQETFGMGLQQEEESRLRFAIGGDAAGQVDVQVRPQAIPGSLGAGIVHHIAFRAFSDEHQLALRAALLERGLDVTPVLDRQYFHSIYFREPGGVLFEIATDPPGFLFDETRENLGTALKLPPWLEPKRGDIQRVLPQLKMPEKVTH